MDPTNPWVNPTHVHVWFSSMKRLTDSSSEYNRIERIPRRGRSADQLNCVGSICGGFFVAFGCTTVVRQVRKNRTDGILATTCNIAINLPIFHSS